MFINFFNVVKYFRLCKEKGHLFFPQQPPLKIEIFSSPTLFFENLVRGSTSPSRKGGVGGAHYDPPIYGIDFSHNISIPQLRVNMRETEHVTFLKLLTSRINPSIIHNSGLYFLVHVSPWLGKMFRFTV